jgi:hypothetical protein
MEYDRYYEENGHTFLFSEYGDKYTKRDYHIRLYHLRRDGSAKTKILDMWEVAKDATAYLTTHGI